MSGVPLLVGLLALSTLDMEVVPQSGAPVSGELVSVDGRQLTLRGEQGEKQFSLRQLRRATVKNRTAAAALNAPIEVAMSCGSPVEGSAIPGDRVQGPHHAIVEWGSRRPGAGLELGAAPTAVQ